MTDGTWSKVSLVSSPQHVFIGDGAAAQVGVLLGMIGVPNGKVALVSDRGVSSLGLTKGPRASLEASGYEPLEYDEIDGEPDEAVADRIGSWLRGIGAVGVVGVGGGSAMDLAKLAAALATNSGAARAYVGQGKVPKPSLPCVLLPTTAGTGSEATRNAILNIDGYKAVISSPHLEPIGAVLDPLLTLGLPRSITASTGLDALTHAIEPYLSTGASAFTDTTALVAMALIARSLLKACADGQDLGARRDLMLGAYLAGLTLNASTLLGHSIAYTIANRTHLPHGVTCAMALPYCVAYNTRAAADRLRNVARAVTGESGAGANELARWAAEANANLGIPPSLQATGISEAEVSAMASECAVRYPRPNNPEPLTEARLTEMYRYMWEGDVGKALSAFAV